MEKISYSDKLKDPRWQKKRLEIFNRYEFTCKLCGDKETTLNIHHKKYVYGKEPWEYDNEELVTLCEHCHSMAEQLGLHKTKNAIDKFSVTKYYSNKFPILLVSVNDLCFIRTSDGHFIKLFDAQEHDHSIKNKIIKHINSALKFNKNG